MTFGSGGGDDQNYIFKLQDEKNAALDKMTSRSKLLLEAHKILLEVYDADEISLETKLRASKLLDKIELDASLFEEGK
jgi:hypothetical protein